MQGETQGKLTVGFFHLTALPGSYVSVFKTQVDGSVASSKW